MLKENCDIQRPSHGGIVIKKNLDSILSLTRPTAMCANSGKRLPGLPRGSSPIIPDGWAHASAGLYVPLSCRKTVFNYLTHLKYRREVARQVLSAGA